MEKMIILLFQEKKRKEKNTLGFRQSSHRLSLIYRIALPCKIFFFFNSQTLTFREISSWHVSPIMTLEVY